VEDVDVGVSEQTQLLSCRTLVNNVAPGEGSGVVTPGQPGRSDWRRQLAATGDERVRVDASD